MSQNDEFDDLPEGYNLVDRLDGPATVLCPDGLELSMAELVQKLEDSYALQVPATIPVAQPLSWMDGEPDLLQVAIDRRQANRDKLLAWIMDKLVDGTDYGRIHFVKKDSCGAGASCTNPAHFSKPSLWKPGAEKICGMLGFRPVWPELAAELGHLKAGSDLIGLRCQLLDASGNIVSEGVGARRLNQDNHDPNKALKMAKKSGLIDAALTVGGLSEVFTQDLSDDDDPTQTYGAPLNEDGQAYLMRYAIDLFGDRATSTLESLARIRFHIDEGRWREIPAYRMQDAIRSLQEKADDDAAVLVCVHCHQQNIGGAQCCKNWDGNQIRRDEIPE